MIVRRARARWLSPALVLVACGARDASPTVVAIDAAGPPPPSVSTVPPHDGPARQTQTSQRSRNADPIAFRTWSTDLEEEARRKHLPLLVYARADWAAACIQIEREVLVDPDVRFAASAYVPVMLDATEESTTVNELAMRMKVDKMPCLKVVRVSGSAASPLLDVGACLSVPSAPSELATTLEDLASDR